MQYKVGQKIITHKDNEFQIIELVKKVGEDKTFGEQWVTNYGTRYSCDFERSRFAAERQIAYLTEMLRKVEESK